MDFNLLPRKEKEVDHWELKVQAADGGWRSPSAVFRDFDTELTNLDDLDEPLDEDATKNTIKSENWPSGKYAMQAKAPNNSVVGYEWTIDHERPDDDAEELDPIDELRRDVQTLARRIEDDQVPAVTGPSEALGQGFHAYLAGDVDEDKLGTLVAMTRDWAATDALVDVDQETDPIVRYRLAKGEIDEAAKYQLARDQTRSAGEGGGSGLMDLVGEGAEVDFEISSFTDLAFAAMLMDDTVGKNFGKNLGAMSEGFMDAHEASQDMSEDLTDQAAAVFGGRPGSREKPAETVEADPAGESGLEPPEDTPTTADVEDAPEPALEAGARFDIPGMDAPPADDVEADAAAASDLGMTATPEPAMGEEMAAGDVELNPSKCQYVKADGEQCSRDPQDGSAYCWQHANEDEEGETVGDVERDLAAQADTGQPANAFDAMQ